LEEVVSTLQEKLDKLKRRPGGDHHMTVIEGGSAEHDGEKCPGTFEIRCSCGEVTWTAWGEAHAAEITTLHLWATGVADIVR
jgi:hypothetical protein